MFRLPPLHTLALPLTLLFATLPACTGEVGDLDYHGHIDEDLSIEITDQTVGEFETTVCSTAAVAPLSRQIAEEMLCMAPGTVVELQPGNGLSFRSEAVLPYMEAEAAQRLRDAAAQRPIEVTSGFRTVVQQYLLRRWYERGRCGIRAAARPGRSNHESGRGVDVSNFHACRSTLRRHSWRDPFPGDPVHFEHHASPDMRGLDVHAFQRLWNRNHPNDRIAEDGEYGPATAARISKAPAAGFPIGPECTGSDSENWVGDSCEDDAGCELPGDSGSCETWFDADEDELHGMCVTGCMGMCPQRSGEVGSFCAEVGESEGSCLPLADASSDACGMVEGAVPRPMRRFQASGSLSSQVSTVCVGPQTKGIECRSGSEIGECIDTDVSTCSGSVVGGACPGPGNILCCLGEAVEEDPEDPEDPEPIECSTGGSSGVCIDTNTESCGGDIAVGLCPGASNIRCCLDEEPDDVVECSAFGAEGVCVDTNTESCGGDLVSGFCPGASNIRCCLD